MTSNARSVVMVSSLLLLAAACGKTPEGDPNTPDAGTLPGVDGGNNNPTDPRLQPPDDLKADPEPEATEVGFELSDPVTQTIGASGGTVSFGNDGPTVVIPAGALGQDTEISIQEVEGFAPHKLGSAWRFGPEGATFSSPVSITFPLPPFADDLSNVEGVGVAFQDEDGFWQAVSDVTVDKANKTVTAKTTHFSDWTLFQQTELRPNSASVEVGKALGLWVYECTREMDPETLLAPLVPTCKAATGYTNWSVNGIPGGDESVGTALPMLYGAAYTAPENVPDANPVAVSVEVTMGKRKGLLVSNLRVFDGDCSFEEPCNWSGTAKWTGDLVGWSNSTVRWVLDRKEEKLHHVGGWRRQVFYKPVSGTVWAGEIQGCTPTGPLDIAEMDSSGRTYELMIDYTDEEPTVHLSDSVGDWTGVTQNCGGEIKVQDYSAYYMDGGPLTLVEDGTAIVGSYFDEEIGFRGSVRLTRE